MNLLITNAKIITPDRVYPSGWLLARDGKITALANGTPPDFAGVTTFDAGGKTLLPGFVDVHVHGSVGVDTMDATPETLHTLSRFFATCGVTSFLATTWTDSHSRIEAALANAQAVMQGELPGARLAGVHLEGPYLNPEKGGAQNKNHIRRADRAEALGYLDYGVIRLLALAAEYEENHWLIAECIKRGITVSVAHTGASYDQTRRAVNLGITHATHTYNAMTGLHHRDPGTLGAVMLSPEVRCEIISDNVHVHSAAVHILWKLKGPDHLILITDAIRAAGMPDGEYPVDERTLYVRNGVATLADGTLAGSVLTFNTGLRNFLQTTGESLERVWQITSLNPARSVNVSHRTGSIETGKDADLVLVDESIDVYLTVVAGRIVYQRGATS